MTNFGSSNTLDSLIYKASASGKTLTGGTDHAKILLTEVTFDLYKKFINLDIKNLIFLVSQMIQEYV